MMTPDHDRGFLSSNSTNTMDCTVPGEDQGAVAKANLEIGFITENPHVMPAYRERQAFAAENTAGL